MSTLVIGVSLSLLRLMGNCVYDSEVIVSSKSFSFGHLPKKRICLWAF